MAGCRDGFDAKVCRRPVIVPFRDGTPAQLPGRHVLALPTDHLPLGVKPLLVMAAFKSVRLCAGRPSRYGVCMFELSCHCGQIRIEILRLPDYFNMCNCSLCSKSGAGWAYFPPDEVSVSGRPTAYRRIDKADPAVDIHFCGHCGSTTHFTLTDSAVAKFGNSQSGVNMRLMDERLLAGVEVRYPDGQAWSGEGDFGYVRAPHLIGCSVLSA